MTDGPMVLVVEDDDADYAMHAELLAAAGVPPGSIARATTLVEATSLFVDRPSIRLVIVDVLLPDGRNGDLAETGKEVAELVAQTVDRPTDIVFVTARAEPESGSDGPPVAGRGVGGQHHEGAPDTAKESLKRVKEYNAIGGLYINKFELRFQYTLWMRGAPEPKSYANVFRRIEQHLLETQRRSAAATQALYVGFAYQKHVLPDDPWSEFHRYVAPPARFSGEFWDRPLVDGYEPSGRVVAVSAGDGRLTRIAKLENKKALVRFGFLLAAALAAVFDGAPFVSQEVFDRLPRRKRPARPKPAVGSELSEAFRKMRYDLNALLAGAAGVARGEVLEKSDNGYKLTFKTHLLLCTSDELSRRCRG